MSQQPVKQPRLAFSIPTNNDAEQRQLFDGFGPQGFEGLQLKGSQYGRYLAQPEKFLHEWPYAKNVCAGLICGGSLDEAGVENLQKTIDFGAVLGTEMIIFCHGQSRATVTPEDIRAYARQLSEIGEKAQRRGIKLSLHNHFDNPVMHRDDIEIFFGAVTPGTVGFTLDTAHLQKSGVFDIAGIVRDFGNIIDNVHLKDFADGQFKTLGQGEIEFAAIFEALHKISFTGWLCADEESETTVQESLRASFDFIKAGSER